MRRRFLQSCSLFGGNPDQLTCSFMSVFQVSACLPCYWKSMNCTLIVAYSFNLSLRCDRYIYIYIFNTFACLFSPYHKVLALMWLSMNVTMDRTLEALMTSSHNLQDLLSLAMDLSGEHLCPISLCVVPSGPNQVFQSSLNLMKMNLMGSDHTLQAITGNKYFKLACRKKKKCS